MTVHVFGGGTVTYVRNHLALCAPAYGTTAKQLGRLLKRQGASVQLHLTKMADARSKLETNDHVEARLREVLADPATTAIIFNVALCDFEGQIGEVPSGKYANRLQTREIDAGGLSIVIHPTKKLLGLVREIRPDVKYVGFKTTANDTPQQQTDKSIRMIEQQGVSLVLANDVGTRFNSVLRRHGPAGGLSLYAGMDRKKALKTLALALLEELQ